LVVALWAAVQIPRLDTRPGYFHGDEATVIIHGRNAYRPNPIGDALDRPMRVRAVEAPWRTVYHPFLTCIPRAYFHYLFPERPYFGSRLYGAIVGSLSVVALFLFTRAGFGRATAWTAALFYASSHLILRYSRSGFTNLDAIVLLGFWGLAFLGAWRSRRVSLALAAGALAGLSYYFYYGALLAIPLTFGLWIFFFATRPRRAIRRRSLALAMAIGFALAAAPNALFNAKWRPSDTRWHRNSVTVFQPSNVEAIRRAVGGEGAIDTMIRYAWPSIGGALLWSNGNFQADYGSGRRPTLNRLLAGLLLLGLVGAAARGRPRRTLAIVVAWWALAIVFGSLLTYGAPYAPRLVTMVAAACILGAWALVDLVRRARGTFGAMAAWMAAGPAVALAAVIAIGDARHYYFDYIEDFENVGYSRTPVGMMAFMKDFPADAKLVLFAPWEFQINTSNMALFDTGFPREIFTDRDSLDAPPPPHPRLATAYAIKLPEFSRVDSAMAARDDIDEVVEIANPYRPSMHPTHRVYWIRPPSP
jgi:hypothetical protein